MQMLHEINPEVIEKMRKIAKQPAGRIDNIIYLKDLLKLPNLFPISFHSVSNQASRNERKIWFAGAPGIIIIDGYEFDSRLYGLLSRGNGHALFSMLPFEERGVSFNIFRDPVTDTVVKAYGREYPVWAGWSLTRGNETANGGFAIHQNQWWELEPWLRKYLPLMPPAIIINEQKNEPAFEG
jgi:hypothetical protein